MSWGTTTPETPSQSLQAPLVEFGDIPQEGLDAKPRMDCTANHTQDMYSWLFTSREQMLKACAFYSGLLILISTIMYSVIKRDEEHNPSPRHCYVLSKLSAGLTGSICMAQPR